MVATRKVPTGRSSATPPAPTPTPKAVKTKAERELKASPGPETAKHTKLKNRNKAKRESKKKSSSKSLADVLSQFLILFFLIYSLAVCPNDDSLEKPICRGLSAYRKLVLEPYVFPSIQKLVVQPVERKIIPLVADTLDKPSVRPYVAKYIAIQNNWVIPAARKSAKEWKTRVAPQWRGRVVPAWNKFVIPQWNRRVIPAWNAYVIPPWQTYVVSKYDKYVTPRLDKYVSPWVVKTHIYLQRVKIWTRRAHAQYVIFKIKSRPYVAFAVAKSQEAAVKAQELYVLASPYLEQLRILFLRLLSVVKAQRVMYVDPHVARLWEKIVELSTTSTSDRIHPSTKGEFKIQTEAVKETISSIPSSVFASESAASVMLESLVGESASSILPTETLVSSASEYSSSAVVETVAVPEPSAEETVVAASTEPAETIEEVLLETSSSPSSSSLSSVESTTTPSAIVEPTSSESIVSTEIATEVTSATSVILPTAHEDPSAVPKVVKDEETASSIPIAATNSAVASQETASPEPELDEDAVLQDFFAEFDPERTAKVEEEPVEEEIDPEVARLAAEEALRIRLEQTAEKRKSITYRHTEWAKQLIALRDQQRIALRNELIAVREDAVKELRGEKASEESSIDTKALIDTLAVDGEKFLKGIESYLKKVVANKQTSKTRDDYEKWTTVLYKVNDKFDEKVTQVEAKVHDWYVDVVERELVQARQASELVKNLAGQAQGDLGLDYAWLDDVSYGDWQRYHDLVRVSEAFDIELACLQNGTVSATHPTTEPIVPNPVLDLLDELQVEVHEVVLGFETRLRSTKGTAEQFFKEILNEDDLSDVEIPQKEAEQEQVAPADENEPTASILPIPIEPTPEVEPVLSILPIEESMSTATESNTPSATPINLEEIAAQEKAAQIVLGRSEKEALQALKRAEEVQIDREEL